MFPILKSPPDETQYFRTCRVHTAWELVQKNGGNERPAAWHGRLHWQGNRQENTEKEVLVKQEYRER